MLGRRLAGLSGPRQGPPGFTGQSRPRQGLPARAPTVAAVKVMRIAVVDRGGGGEPGR